MTDPDQSLIELFGKRYANHEIVAQSETEYVRYWKFQNPGDCHYQFEVIATASRVVIQGDIGHLIFCKSLGWCRGVLCREGLGISWGYVAEKVAREIPVEQYSEDLAKKCFVDTCVESKPHMTVEDVEECVDEHNFETLESFIETMEDVGVSDAWELTPGVMALKHDFVNQVIALREFIKKLDGESNAN